MKNLILILCVSAGSGAAAADACVAQGKTTLAQKMKIKEATVVYFNGAVLGDGADAVEIDFYQIVGRPGLFKVEQDAEDCILRSVEAINN